MISLMQTSLTSEIIESDFGIKISDTTLNNWMRAEDVLSQRQEEKQRNP